MVGHGQMVTKKPSTQLEANAFRNKDATTTNGAPGIATLRSRSDATSLEAAFHPGLLGARTLLGAPGLTTRSKKLLVTKGIATRS